MGGPMKFYVVKVQLQNGDLRHPFTLFAKDDQTAQAAADEKLRDETVASIHIKAIHQLHLEFYGRQPDDQRGIVEHVDTTWSGPGPIQAIELFGSKKASASP